MFHVGTFVELLKRHHLMRFDLFDLMTIIEDLMTIIENQIPANDVPCFDTMFCFSYEVTKSSFYKNTEIIKKRSLLQDLYWAIQFFYRWWVKFICVYI